jgi:transposase, IS6 family
LCPVDETSVRVAGARRYLYRAVDQFGQVIDVMLSERRDTQAARRFFDGAMVCGARPVEVTTDRAATYPAVLDQLLPGAFHNLEKYANNRVEADHRRLKARLTGCPETPRWWRIGRGDDEMGGWEDLRTRRT